MTIIRVIVFSFVITGCAHEVYFGGNPQYVEPKRKPTIADNIAWVVYIFHGIPGL